LPCRFHRKVHGRLHGRTIAFCASILNATVRLVRQPRMAMPRSYSQWRRRNRCVSGRAVALDDSGARTSSDTNFPRSVQPSAFGRGSVPSPNDAIAPRHDNLRRDFDETSRLNGLCNRFGGTECRLPPEHRSPPCGRWPARDKGHLALHSRQSCQPVLIVNLLQTARSRVGSPGAPSASGGHLLVDET
jgi:hypothetical protein